MLKEIVRDCLKVKSNTKVHTLTFDNINEKVHEFLSNSSSDEQRNYLASVLTFLSDGPALSMDDRIKRLEKDYHFSFSCETVKEAKKVFLEARKKKLLSETKSIAYRPKRTSSSLGSIITTTSQKGSSSIVVSQQNIELKKSIPQQQNTTPKTKEFPFVISSDDLSEAFKNNKGKKKGKGKEKDEEESQENAFLSALSNCPSFDEISKSGGSIRIPANLGKNEGSGVFSFYPHGQPGDDRIVMYIDENHKFHFCAYAPDHKKSYDEALKKAKAKAEEAKGKAKKAKGKVKATSKAVKKKRSGKGSR